MHRMLFHLIGIIIIIMTTGSALATRQNAGTAFMFLIVYFGLGAIIEELYKIRRG